MIFGQPKPKYPRLTNDMLKPVDATMTTAEAKRIYRELMMQIGYHDGKLEAKWGAEELEYAIKQHKDNLEFEVDEAIQSAACMDDERDNLKEIKAELKRCHSEVERAELMEEITDIERVLNREANHVVAAKAARDAFKKCKRAFLIAYINEQLHGRDT